MTDRPDDLLFDAMAGAALPMVATDPRLPDNPIVYANPAFLRLSGYAAAEVVGRNCRFLQGPGTDPDAVAAIRDAVQAGRECAVEVLNYRKDGTPFRNALYISPVVRDGEAVLFFASQLDTTGVEEADAERLRQRRKMESIGQLAAGIAHDFNNALQVVIARQAMAAAAVAKGDTAKAGRDLAAADQAARRAADLAKNLLAFAREAPPEPRDLDANAAVRAVFAMAQATIGVPVSLDLDPESGSCRAEPGQFESALLNLLINARDALEGRTDGRIAVSTRRERSNDGGDRVALSVSDNGPGMPPAVLSRATEAFFTTKPQGKGTGLGLSQVREFAERAGGGVRVFSAPGEGTAVVVLLPALPSPDPPPGS